MTSLLRKLSRSRLFRDVSFLTFSGWIGQAILLWRGYLIPKGLGTQGFGEWRVVTLILFYSTFTHFGAIEAFQREAPVLRGKGDLARLRAVSETTWGFWNLMSALAMVGLMLYAFLSRGRHDAELTFCLYLAAPLLLLQSVQYFLSAKLATEVRFTPISIAMLIQGAANLAGILILLRTMKIYGAVLSVIITNTIMIAYLFYHARPKVFGHIRGEVLTHLVKMGLPITILLVLSNALITIDQIVVGKVRGRETMGIYGLSFSVLVILMRIPSMIATAVEPRFLEDSGRHGITQRSYLYIREQVLVLSLAMPFFAGLAAIGVAPTIRRLLPDFVRAIPVIQVALIGFCAISYTFPLKSMIILRGIQWRCIPILMGGLLACVLLDLAAIYHWKQALAPVACASAIAQIVLSAVLIQYVLAKGLREQKGGTPLFHLRVFGLLALGAFLVWGLLKWVRLPGAGITADFASALLQAGIFALTFGVLTFSWGRALYKRVSHLVSQHPRLEPDEMRVPEV